MVGSGTVASGVTLYTVPGSSSASSATASVVAAALPPRLLLAVTDVLGRLVHVKRGTPYLRCAAHQVPTPALPCEPLGLASDDLDGDLTDWVALCPPTDCARSQCREHVNKQPAACGVDTVNGDVGSTFTLRLVAFNSRGLNATTGAWVIIVYWRERTKRTRKMPRLYATVVGGGQVSKRLLVQTCYG